MASAVSTRPLHWFHPEFNLHTLYELWCRSSKPVPPVSGIWQSAWNFEENPHTPPAPESFFRGRIPGASQQTLWVATRRVAGWLQGCGYPNAHAIGAPAVYIPQPQAVRVPRSLLALFCEPQGDIPLILKELNDFLEILEAARPRFEQIRLCLPPPLYRRIPDWIWQVRQRGLQIMPFEENPFDAFSLRESARLFASTECVAGNIAGHWTAHAALRGAQVFLGNALRTNTLLQAGHPRDTTPPDSDSPDLAPWGAEALGASDRKSPEELARLFGWPLPEEDTSHAWQDERRIFCEEWESERVCAEIASRGQIPEAAALYDQLTREQADNPHFPLVLSGLHLLMGNPQEAVSLLEKAAERIPHSAPIRNKLAMAYFQTGNTAQATSCIEQVLQTDPRNPVSNLKLGQFLLASGRLKPATGCLAHALSMARQAPPELLWFGAANRLFPERALLVSCSTASEARAEELLLVRSYRQNLSHASSRVDLDVTFENTRGLPEIYNEKLEAAAAAGYEFAVFVHDDVSIEESRLLEKLQQAHRTQGFELIGLAGGQATSFQYPTLWHLMCPKRFQRGAVGHFQIENTLQQQNAYGYWPAPVTLIDGLFMAVHVPTALAVGWRFNTAFQFHHYDLAGSLDAGLRGMTVGVFPIHAVHASGGLKSFDDPAWRQSDRIFRELYGTDSPPTPEDESTR